MSSRFYERLLIVFIVLGILALIYVTTALIWGIVAPLDWLRAVATLVLLEIAILLLISGLGAAAENREKRK